MDEATFEGCSVIFQNVREWYAPKSSIFCQFSVKEKSNIEKCASGCFVGVFHVGWDTLGASITNRSFSIAELLTNDSYQVQFLDNELPAPDNDEFYQFCFYDVNTEVVYGASCPFQICHQIESMESFVVCGGNTKLKSAISPRSENKDDMDYWMKENHIQIDNDEDFDTVMVISKTTIVEENLSKAKKENEVLLMKNENMKFESENHANEIDRLNHDAEMKNQRFAMLEQNVNESEKVIECLNNKMKEMKEWLVKEHNDKLKELLSEKEQLEASRAKVNLENNMIKAELQDKRKEVLIRNDKVENLSNEVVVLKNCLKHETDQRKVFENKCDHLMANYTEATIDFAKEKEETKETEARLIEIASDLRIEKQKNAGLLAELDNASAAIELVKGENQYKENDFVEKEKALREHIADLTEALNTLQNQIDELTEASNTSNTKIECFMISHTDLENQISEITEGMEDKQRIHNGIIDKLQITINKQADLIDNKNVTMEELEKGMETKNMEILKLNYIIDNQHNEAEKTIYELNLTVKDLEKQLNDQRELKPLASTRSESGSHHALQVAYTHIQKQLKQIKGENEELRNMCTQANTTDDRDTNAVIKENKELKLRLCMGKQAYERMYKDWQSGQEELTSMKRRVSSNQEIQISASLTKDHDKQEEEKIADLTERIEALDAELVASKNELAMKEETEIDLQMNIKDLRDKSWKLARHFEGKITLLEEENILLKKQKSALLEGGATSMNKELVVELPPKDEQIIDHQPKELQKNVIYQPLVKQQQQGNIAYPPSMNTMDREKKEAWLPLPSVVTDATQPRNNVPVPPASQMIANREPEKPRPITYAPGVAPVSSLTLHGRGKPNGVSSQEPTHKCPVCNFPFPPGYSELLATKHVNDHF